MRRVFVNPSQEGDVVLRKGRIDADRHQRQPNLREPIERRFSIMSESAFQPRHVHKAQGTHLRQLRQLHFQGRDSFLVFGILALGNETTNIFDRDFLDPTVEKVRECSLTFTVSYLSYDRSHGSYADRKKIASQEVIEETTLAGFESPDDGDV